jgi:hypothetical protein
VSGVGRLFALDLLEEFVEALDHGRGIFEESFQLFSRWEGFRLGSKDT